jgi:hypothetical protein
MVSPALMAMMQKSMGQDLREAGAPFKFAPDEGPALSRWMRMIALLPDSKGRQPRSPRGGVCLFEKIRATVGASQSTSCP